MDNQTATAAASATDAGTGTGTEPVATSSGSLLQVTLSQFLQPPGPGVYEPGPPAQSPPPMATSFSAMSPQQRVTPNFPTATATAAAPLFTTARINSTLPSHRHPVFSPIVNSPHAVTLSATHAEDWSSLQQTQLQQEQRAAAAFAGAPLRSIYPSLIPPSAPESLPPFLRAIYASSSAELATYDALIRAQVAAELDPVKMANVGVVVGIPFYTESANIHSVLITMRDVFQLRRQRALFIIMGEHARQDCVASITDCAEIERGEEWEKESFVCIETMVKPHAKYASKPWTVRALQIIASLCGPDGAPAAGADPEAKPAPIGAHLLIMDADIQFNHWELSAQSLVSSLLDPLQGWETARDRAMGIEPLATGANPEGVAPVEQMNHVPTPPVLKSRLQPLYPSPLPLTLVRGGQGDGLEDSEAEAEAEPPLAQTTFSPVFAVRSPDGYPDSPLQPCMPSCGGGGADQANTKSPPPAATFVVLNAPRSFFADDAIVHLVSYLHTAMSLGLEVHQSHGGEFSMHRDMNRAFLGDDSIVYDRAYCVEAQMAARAAFVHPRERPELFPSLRLTQMESRVREEVLSAGCSVLEVLMKGKWHAKITLGKLLAFEAEPAASASVAVAANTNAVLHAGSKFAAQEQSQSQSEGDKSSGSSAASTAATTAGGTSGTSTATNPAHNPSYPGPAPPTATCVSSRGSRARIDLVSEKLLNESIFWSNAGLSTPAHHSSVPLLHHTGGPAYVPNPDPKAQSLRVLAPTSARKQMVRSLKLYAQALLLEHVEVAGGGPGNLPAQSRFLTQFLPTLQRLVCKRRSTDAANYIVSYARASALPSDPWHPSRMPQAERDQFVVFGPHEWSAYTIELLQIYRKASSPEQRRAVISAHRLVWLLGCTALLNDHSHCLWGHMHSTMHQVYAPVFRRKYLAEFLGVPPDRVREMMRGEMGTHQQFSPSPPPAAQQHGLGATTMGQPRPHTDFSVAISAITAH